MPFEKGHEKIGGIKEGSKHKKTIEQEMALKVMREEITERMFGEDGLLQKKIELATGIYVMKPVIVKGVVVDVKVYQEKPDSQSLEYLFSMVVGKPREKIDFTKIVRTELNEEDKELLRQALEYGRRVPKNNGENNQ